MLLTSPRHFKQYFSVHPSVHPPPNKAIGWTWTLHLLDSRVNHGNLEMTHSRSTTFATARAPSTCSLEVWLLERAALCLMDTGTNTHILVTKTGSSEQRWPFKPTFWPAMSVKRKPSALWFYRVNTVTGIWVRKSGFSSALRVLPGLRPKDGPPPIHGPQGSSVRTLLRL